MTERCPYCDTPNGGEMRDDCCAGAGLRAENARLSAELAALEREFAALEREFRYAAGLADD